MVDVDAAFREELFDVAVRQAEPQIPADPPTESPRAETGSRRTPTREMGTESIMIDDASSFTLVDAAPDRPTQQSRGPATL